MVTNQALVNFLTSMSSEAGITAKDALLAVSTFAFDIAALEIYFPLISGASLVMAKREEAADGAALSEKLSLHDITVMQATPATWKLLLAVGWKGKKDFKAGKR